nr:unnamed protein product [Callosobruchus analis]
MSPTYEELAEYIDLDLVPFGKGKAKRHGDKWEFECQHGPEECDINTYDSCAIDMVPTPKALAFVKCSLTQFDTISSIMQSQRGDELLARNAEKSKKAGYYKVPAVGFNGTFDSMDSDLAVGKLKLLICSMLTDVPQCKE